MKTEVYTCDICKQSKSRDDLAKINIKSEGIQMKDVGYNGITIDVCQDCLKKKGFVVECKTEEREQAAAQNRDTIKDKIYDLLSDIGVVFEE